MWNGTQAQVVRSSKHVNWKREVARDIRALGSPIFYALVVMRIAIDPLMLYLWQLLITAGVICLLSFFVKSADYYVARALALVVLTNIFYGDLLFGLFASALFLVLLYAATFLEIPKRSVLQGILAGAVSVGMGYAVAPLLL